MSIFGAGGGGGKGGGGARKAKEAKDNLDSTAYASIIELLSEGEIEGFATPSRLGLVHGTNQYANAAMKDIFFNKTPLLRGSANVFNPQEADFNFQNVTFATRLGTQDQAYVPGFDAIENEVSVGVNVTEGSPVTRTITNNEIDAVRLTINVPLLQEFKSNGDIVGATIDLTISLRYNGGSTQVVISDRIAGRTSDLYQRDYLVNLNGQFPVDIIVTRITPDSDSAKLTNAFSLFSYTEIIYQKLRYPNSAYIALRVDAEQFSSIPSRSYRIRGIKVKIPSNATANTENGRLVYSGVWDGTFGAAAWTTDPAWILYDLLTSTRYGFGDHIQEESLDKWAFFRASQYCNELVPTGLPSPTVEPRFSCNVSIQTQEDAYKLINDMCSVFRAMPFWAAGSLTITQDRPSDPVAIFSLANVTEQGFYYEGSSLKGRATVAIVSWLNLELGDLDREVVEDPVGIARYGVITKELSAFACTSRSQARRIGEWLLYTEQEEKEVVSFTTGIDNGIVLRPGAIIEINDPVKAGVRLAGRIAAATGLTITVDDGADLPGSGTLRVVLPDGTLEDRPIANVNQNVITVIREFSTIPNTGAIWLVDSDEVRPTLWRVLSVQEQDGVEYAVVGVSYNPSKYAYIERGEPLQERDITVLDQPPDTPSDVLYEQIRYELNGRVLIKLSITWRPVRGSNEYRIRWRNDFTNWIEVTVYGPEYTIENISEGQYQIEIYAISATQLLSSAPAVLDINVSVINGTPSNPSGLTVTAVSEDSALLQWSPPSDLDVLVGGETLIRHDPRTTNASWSNANEIASPIAGNQAQAQVPLLTGTYFVAFRSQQGVVSANPSSVVATLPDLGPRLQITGWRQDLDTFPFTGPAINMTYDSTIEPGMILGTEFGYDTGAYYFSKISNNPPSGGGSWVDVTLNGVGTIGALDLGAVYDIYLRRRILSTALVKDTWNFDSATEQFDDQPGVFDGELGANVNAAMFFRVTNDNPASTSAVWSPWITLTNCIAQCRGITVRVLARTATLRETILLTELGATVQMRQSTQAGTPADNVSQHTVVFSRPFFATPDIVITPFNMAAGDYFTIPSRSRTGFTVRFWNSSGVAVNRSMSWSATGYGQAVTP